jgi:hypothetical protein
MSRIAHVITSAVLLAFVPAQAAVASVSRTDARRAAVRASARTCDAVPWCDGYGVVAAERCRHVPGGVVTCAMWFLTAAGERCGGVVTVKQGSGRLDIGMAVPMNCAGRSPRA